MDVPVFLDCRHGHWTVRTPTGCVLELLESSVTLRPTVAKPPSRILLRGDILPIERVLQKLLASISTFPVHTASHLQEWCTTCVTLVDMSPLNWSNCRALAILMVFQKLYLLQQSRPIQAEKFPWQLPTTRGSETQNKHWSEYEHRRLNNVASGFLGVISSSIPWLTCRCLRWWDSAECWLMRGHCHCDRSMFAAAQSFDSIAKIIERKSEQKSTC